MKKFILSPTINEEHHVIPIERIISVEPYNGSNIELKSSIIVNEPMEKFNSTCTVEKIHYLIQTENYRQ